MANHCQQWHDAYLHCWRPLAYEIKMVVAAVSKSLWFVMVLSSNANVFKLQNVVLLLQYVVYDRQL